MSPKQARQLCEQAGAPLPEGLVTANYEKVVGTRRKVLDGIEFRSTLEADVYVLLKSWERAGAIRNLVCQPKYLLQPKMRVDGKAMRAITYIADFQYERIRRGLCPGHGAPPFGWETVTVDAKGHRMEVYKVKLKLFLAKFPHIRFEEWSRETLKANGG